MSEINNTTIPEIATIEEIKDEIAQERSVTHLPVQHPHHAPHRPQ